MKRSDIRGFISTFVIAFSLPFAAMSQTDTWDGGGGDNVFGTGANWADNSSPSPGSASDLIFTGTTRLTPVNNYTAFDDFRNITFTSGAGSFSVSGNSIDWFGKIENNDDSDQSVSLSNLSMKKAGGGEVNPVSGNLTIGGGGEIFNDNNEDLHVYGDNGFTLTLGMDFNGNSSASLIVEENSIARITVAQSYAGTTEIDEGAVHIAEGGSLNGGTVFVGNGGTIGVSASFLIVDANGGTTIDETVDINAGSGGNRTVGGNNTSGVNTYSGAISRDSDGDDETVTLTAASGGTVAYSGALGGDDNVIIDGGGTTRFLTTAKTYTGDTVIQGSSTLQLNTANMIADSSDISIGSGSTLELNGVNEGVKSLSGAGNVALTSGGDLTIVDGAGQTLSGAINGTGDVLKQGTANQTLSGVNTFSGSLYIDQGTITIGSGGDITAAAGIDLGSSVFSGGAADATLDLASGASALDRNITVQSGSGGRTLSSAGNNTISGTVDLNKNLALSSSSGTLTLSGTVDLSNSGDNDISISGAGDVTMSGNINSASGAADVNKSGSGTLTISGDNGTAAGGELYKLNISQGTVYLNSANALGQSLAYSDKVNFNTQASTLRVGASMTHSSMGMTFNNVNSTFQIDAGVTFSVGGAINNTAGSTTISKTGSGTLNFTGSAAANDVSVSVSAGSFTGSGITGTLVINSGGSFSPGNSPGTMAAGSTTWNNGGTYVWEMNDVTAGGVGTDPGWDLLNITGSLTVNAGFTIDITSLTLANAAGDVNDFVGTTDYIGVWEIARTTTGISGSPLSPTLDLSGFTNPYDSTPGSWYLSQIGNSLYLNYDYQGGALTGGGGGGGGGSIPEPSSFLFMGVASVLVVGLRKHTRRQIVRR